jgi:hypothetical protein
MKTWPRLSAALTVSVLLVAAAPALAQFRVFEPPVRMPFVEPPVRMPFVERPILPRSFELPGRIGLPELLPGRMLLPELLPGRMPPYLPSYDIGITGLHGGNVGISGLHGGNVGIPGLYGGNIGFSGYDPFGSGNIVGRMGGAGSILGQPRPDGWWRPGRGSGYPPVGSYPPVPYPVGTPAPRPRTPAEVQRDIEARLKTAPHLVFIWLRQEGSILPAETRLQLADRATNELVTQAGTTNLPLDLLPQVKQAALHAPSVNPDLGKRLDAVRGRLQALALQDVLDGVAGLLEKRDWAGAAGRAADPRLMAVRIPAEAGRAFQEVAGFPGRLESVDRLEKTLATTAARPAEALSQWRGLPIETLPDKLREPARGLRALAELRALAAAPAAPGRDLADARRAAADLAATSRDTAVGWRALQSLACKEFLAGNTDAARLLLPKDGPADHAAALLRDMKAMLLGEGRVETWPAAQALPPEAGGAGGGKRGPPPGLRLLMPEGSPEGWRPPQRESALDGLPPLNDAAPTERALRDQAFAGIRGVREETTTRAAEALHVIHLARSHVHVPPPSPSSDDKAGSEDEAYLATVERELGHKLTPPERAAALRHKKEGRSPQAAAAQMAPMEPVKE